MPPQLVNAGPPLKILDALTKTETTQKAAARLQLKPSFPKHFCTAPIHRCSMKSKLLACIQLKRRSKTGGMEEIATSTECSRQAGSIWSLKPA